MRYTILYLISTTLLLSPPLAWSGKKQERASTPALLANIDQNNKVTKVTSDNHSIINHDNLDPSETLTKDTVTHPNKGFYIGFAGGIAMDHWSRQIHQALPYQPWHTSNITHVKYDLQPSYQAKIGYAFSPELSLEAAYFSMPNNTISLSNMASTNISHHNTAIMGRLSVKLAKNWFYFKLGSGYMTQQFSNEMSSRHQWTPVLGLGNYYIINHRLSVGIDYTHFMNTQSRRSKTYLPSQDYLMINLQIHFSKT